MLTTEATMPTKIDTHRFCVAPMMARTDRHCRYFMRLLSKHAILYTEMIHAQSLLRGDHKRLLNHDPTEHPLALQLGGVKSQELALAAKLARKAGYSEINLNAGCPSTRATSAGVGACMMRKPELVGECLKALDPSQGLVSVKCRIGVDELDSKQFLHDFAGHVVESGCKLLIVHARKAWLKGLNPKQNRSLPSLNYERVYQLKQEMPQLRIIINGGINTLDECERHLEHVDGVMLGRAVYAWPMLLSGVDRCLYRAPTQNALNPEEVLMALLPYLRRKENMSIYHVLRHTLGIYRHTPGARIARQSLGAVRTLKALEEFVAMRVQDATRNQPMVYKNRTDSNDMVSIG